MSRLTTGVPILHPQVHSYSARWELGQGVSERFFRLTAESLPVLENSPVKTVYSGGGSVRATRRRRRARASSASWPTCAAKA